MEMGGETEREEGHRLFRRQSERAREIHRAGTDLQSGLRTGGASDRVLQWPLRGQPGGARPCFQSPSAPNPLHLHPSYSQNKINTLRF
jgi:hypothetical protein